VDADAGGWMDGAVRFVDVEVLAGAAGRGCPFVPVVITHVPSYWLAGPGGQNINTSVIVLTFTNARINLYLPIDQSKVVIFESNKLQVYTQRWLNGLIEFPSLYLT
jgi:hypothetical protein